MHVIEEGDFDPREEDGSDDEVEEEIFIGDEGEPMNCIIQLVLLTPKIEEDIQRHSIFRMRCTIKNLVYNMIIDSGSYENIVSKALVNTMG